jgi:hypothetical protein
MKAKNKLELLADLYLAKMNAAFYPVLDHTIQVTGAYIRNGSYFVDVLIRGTEEGTYSISNTLCMYKIKKYFNDEAKEEHFCKSKVITNQKILIVLKSCVGIIEDYKEKVAELERNNRTN